MYFYVFLVKNLSADLKYKKLFIDVRAEMHANDIFLFLKNYF